MVAKALQGELQQSVGKLQKPTINLYRPAVWLQRIYGGIKSKEEKERLDFVIYLSTTVKEVICKTRTKLSETKV